MIKIKDFLEKRSSAIVPKEEGGEKKEDANATSLKEEQAPEKATQAKTAPMPEKKPIKEAKKKPKKKREKNSRPLLLRLSTQDQIFFTKRLSMILRSGMPIMEGLSMLNDHVESRSSSYIYQSLIADVAKGQTLSSGLEKFKRIFGDFSVNIIRVGEMSGTLHENLEHIAVELKKKQALRRKVIGALIYPALIVFATLGIVALLTVYLFPKIAPIFVSVHAELPLSTRILMAISGFLIEYGIILMLGFFVLLVAIFFLMRIRRVHLFFDRILLRIPLIGRLSQYYNLANITRTLGILLKSDIRIVLAMDLVIGGLKNIAFQEALIEAQKHITQGQNISSQLKKYPTLFPPMMMQMVTAAEATGNLSGTMLFLSDTYEEEIEELTKNLTTLLEPILMIVMGFIVGFVAISIITPIYSITQNLNPYH